jgi:hypothetical protein
VVLGYCFGFLGSRTLILWFWIPKTRCRRFRPTILLTYPLNSDYLTNDGRVEKNSSDIEDESKLISDFIDACRELIPIRTSYTGNTGELQEIRQ